MQDEYNKKHWEHQQANEKGFSLARLDIFKNTSKKSIKNSRLLKHFPKILALCIIAFPLIFMLFNLNKLDRRIEELEQELEQIESLYRIDSTEYHDLKNTPSLIEHIAREDYYMKSEGEEIYIIKKVK